MTRTLLIARRELTSYLSGAFGWIIIALVLMLDGVLFNGIAMEGERATSHVLFQFFYFSAGVTMVASVFIAMRTLAAEREQSTLVLLQTSPLGEWELVLGKFLGAFAFLSLLVLATLYMPLLVDVNGQVEWGQVSAGYLGLLLLGAASLAIGVFASSISRNQMLAAVIGGVLIVFMLTCWYLSKRSDPPFSNIFGYMALFNKHFQPFMEGVVHLRSLVYYGTVVFVFLLFSVRVLQTRRWR